VYKVTQKIDVNDFCALTLIVGGAAWADVGLAINVMLTIILRLEEQPRYSTAQYSEYSNTLVFTH
jgi:hypothetical protein